MKPSYFQRAASGARRNFLQTSAGLAAAALVPVPLATAEVAIATFRRSSLNATIQPQRRPFHETRDHD